MRLDFHGPYLSITQFPSVVLPQLSIIVGLNGSGKTHLLQAIQSGAIDNSVAPIPRRAGGNLAPMPHATSGPIRLLANNVNNMHPGYSPVVESTYSPNGQMAADQAQGVGFDTFREHVLRPFLEQLEAAVAMDLSTILQSEEDPWRLGAEEFANRAGVDKTDIEAVFSAAASSMERPQFRSPGGASLPPDYMEQAKRAATISRRLEIPILNLRGADVSQFPQWQTDQFAFDLARLFGRYRDLQLKNRLQQIKDADSGTKQALSKTDFENTFGQAPWKILNETFSAFGLPYEAAPPDEYEYSAVSFSLRKKPGGQEVHPQNLSSGERVLLQFAISSYHVDDGMTTIKRPRLLLLDEMDAPLHPAMVHRWLGAVNDGLVKSQGVHCILTTHSPTTVALAPEEALYEMIGGTSGVRKISKQEALNKLTFGVPTLSINYSGRRQVFTESDTDASIYEKSYSLIKSLLDCKRELNFISTGMRNKNGGEINSGCTVVKNIVQNLRDFGNITVFGIVDWDGENVSSDFTKVVSEGIRNGIENLLLDPILVCLLLMKFRRPPEGISDIDSFVGAGSLSARNFQRLVDAVQITAFPESQCEKVSISYVGGSSAEVLKDYLTIDDHSLENGLSEKFPALQKWTRSGRGSLVNAIVDEVLTEYPQFCPSELKALFECLANPDD